MAVSVAKRASPSPEGGTSDAGRLYECYSNRLLAYCLHVLRSRPEAEDAVQTTFLYAHRALQRGVVPESEYAWLQAIARNVCRWQQRTAARRRVTLTDVDVDAIAASADDDARELAEGLAEALAAIPEPQRRALVLREWHGLSASEVASRIGMTAPATYALLTRARRSFARALAAPRTLAVDLVGLVPQIRAWVGGWFAGAGAKAAVTGVLALGVAAGGFASRLDADDDAARPGSTPPVAPAAVSATAPNDERAPAPGPAPARANVRTATRASAELVSPNRSTPATSEADRAATAPTEPSGLQPERTTSHETESSQSSLGGPPVADPLTVPGLEDVLDSTVFDLSQLPVGTLPDAPELPVGVVPPSLVPPDLSVVPDLPVTPLPGAGESLLP